ncbi:hypothetical protein CCR75_006533 [Bremia lactucae]|uniref:J domain-containing protein n=1 Tax=Bremia lactucae TaxID=4779 RepID=A0A976FPM6_BRELC|nr:hypothetical protein CCR75_006533 [Bremia lactucae]
MERSTNTKSIGLSHLEVRQRRALLAKIAKLEARGAILPSDARTLRSQVHESSSGHWKAVEVRLQQLACNWNPYQDGTRVTSNPFPLNKKKYQEVDYYQLLELEKDDTLTTEDFKRQFRKLALQMHPDKKRANRKQVRNSEDEKGEADNVSLDSTQFARLRLAYETLSDHKRRSEYDTKLLGIASPQQIGKVIKNQVKLEASTDFASLEWMARVKHKMDVMAQIPGWAKLLSLHSAELRFETGEPCTGKDCGKIVSMDRDLECLGSLRRRVYICLLHKYIHSCDESCTSLYDDAEFDRRVCQMRAYWLIQNWIFDQFQVKALQRQKLTPLQTTANPQQVEVSATEILKHEDGRNHCASSNESRIVSTVCEFEERDIHLGDYNTRFQIENVAECKSPGCRTSFQYLEEGIYACRRHGTPHICTFEQCNQQEVQAGTYICWVSGKKYGCERVQAGTDVRTRRLVFLSAPGEENAVEMEVPVMLPLGKATEYLLMGDSPLSNYGIVSSLSPPPPDEKAWNKQLCVASGVFEVRPDDCQLPKRDLRKKLKRDHEPEQNLSSVRRRLHDRFLSKFQRSDTTSFFVFLNLPRAVAILPKVVLELEQFACSSSDDEHVPHSAAIDEKNLLQITVSSHCTVNYIKCWIEEITEQQLSIWDQQIYWGDTLIGEETNEMNLSEHGISAGCTLELRLHDDCPLLLSTWNGKSAASGRCGGAFMEYSTVQISKEAAEDLDELQEEYEIVTAAEEQAFQEYRIKRKRKKLELSGAIKHSEVLRYDNAKSEPRLLGMIRKRIQDVDDRTLKRHVLSTDAQQEQSSQKEDLLFIEDEELVKGEQEQVSTEIKAMRSVSMNAQPLGIFG